MEIQFQKEFQQKWGKYFSGAAFPELRPNFDYFLSCGISGEMEGERHK